MAIDNPRFPHSVVVKRSENAGTQAAPVMLTNLILTSECRNSVSTKGANKRSVMESEYTIALPRHDVSVLAGDTVEVTDRVRTIYGTVVESQVHNFGANIYYVEVKN